MTAVTTVAGGVDADAHKFTNITSATTTAIKSGEGKLVRITINTKATSGVVTIYDNTAGSGTTIGTITNPGTLLDNAQTYEYGVHFRTGLTIVTSGTQNITVVWD